MSTPIPWAVRPSSDPRNGSDWRDIVSLGTEFPSYVGEAHKDDARLIAAAPDMLAALRAIAGMRMDNRTDHAQLLALCVSTARVAIERATGETS